MMRLRHSQSAFTLAELLIALAILGVIATFTIPKILDSGSDSKFNAIGKETAAMVSGAYQSYKLNNAASGSTSFQDLTPYMNYVKVDTTTTIDDTYNGTTQNCFAASRSCILLHNGALLYHRTGVTDQFGDTSSTSSILFEIDPDGRVTSTGAAGTAGKSVQIAMYFNGRVTTIGNIEPNTYYGGGGAINPLPANDPPWFNWGN